MGVGVGARDGSGATVGDRVGCRVGVGVGARDGSGVGDEVSGSPEGWEVVFNCSI